MVFEAIVVELLNKFLNQYVENLDTSQLKIGIWGGDVVLQDLKIKTTLFDDLNLPVRVKWGRLGKFAMKIPWKNLYGSQVVVDIEELLMVVIPNTEFKYDPALEEKWENDRKQAKLKAVEEAKKRELETDATKQNDGFIEKLLTQIIKNIQIFIKNIHVRYEDKTTIPGSPFSFGVTMSKLSAETTTVDPDTTSLKRIPQNPNFICKVVNLEGLAIYWNSLSKLFADLPRNEMAKALVQSIPSVNRKPEGYMYIFGPLSASAFLRLNPKPETDGTGFSVPKVFVNVHLNEIELAITRHQFLDIVLLLQDCQRLAAASKFRKYRPRDIPVTGHAKEWWRFAYSAVSEDIKRRKNEWCWLNIKKHRQMCRTYSELFKLKLNSKKVPAEVTNELKELEKKLNVFNLVLLREQVLVEVERSNLKKEEQKSGGWFSGWFGYGSETKSDPGEEEIVKKIEKVMTPQEKQKLYKAIGYEESVPPTKYPPTFVEVQFRFHLDEIKVSVSDDDFGKMVPIISLSVKTVKTEFDQRPSAFAMKLGIIVGNFKVIGKKENDGALPELVTSRCEESESLVEVLYEKKPLNASCDQRVNVTARPLRIIYHAETINRLREIFKTEAQEDVSKIVAATSASLPTFKTITALGLQYAIEKRAKLEVKVNIMSSYLIIPYGGVYHPNKELLVIMLGSLKVETEENQKDVSVKKLYSKGAAEQDIFSAFVSASYTNFRCELTGVQVLMQLIGEDWVQASNIQGPSPLRFLENTNLVVTIKKSLVTDDARIPKMVVEGKLPSLTFNFSEERLISLAALICSIPFNSEPATLKKTMTSSAWSVQSIGTQLESKLGHFQGNAQAPKSVDYVQGIDFVGNFEMNELVVNISKTKPSVKIEKKPKDPKSTVEEQFLNLRLVSLQVASTSKTFETIQVFKLGNMEFNQRHKNTTLPFVTTKGIHPNSYLFVIEYITIDTKAPDFYTRRGGIRNRLTTNITPLSLVLNQEAILAQVTFITTVKERLDLVKQNCKKWREGDTGALKDPIYEEEGSHVDKKVITKGKRFRKKLRQKEVIDFFLEATIDQIDIIVEFEGHGLAEFCLKDGAAEMSSRKSYSTMDLKLREIYLLDLNPATLHNKIMTSREEQTLSSRITVYNSEYFGKEPSVDMFIEAEIGGLHCTFVQMFFIRAIAFLNTFQVRIETLKEGATVAAQKAKENVMKAYKNATKICLDVKITAPVLLIPKTSTSLEALFVDLGVLTIKNSITELDETSCNEVTSRPLIDTMKLHLQNLKFSRCELSSENLKIFQDEKTFLIPVTFELTIKRNLSFSWFNVTPELELLARLASIQVKLTHDDVSYITVILKENFKEGNSYNPPEKSTRSQRAENKPLTKHTISQNKPQLQQQQQQVEEEEAEPEVLVLRDAFDADSQPTTHFTKVKFKFFMDSFVFDAIAVDNPKAEDPDVGLCRFVLETFSLKGRMFTDGTVLASMLLVSCLLEDTRPGKEGRLTRLMEKRIDYDHESDHETALNPINSMIEMHYQKKGKDTFVDIRVSRFTLILSMDFLQKLRQFFTIEADSPKSVDDLIEPEKVVRIDKVLHKVEEGLRPPTFTVNLRLEKPDIIVVENIDSIDTDALIFHTEIVFKQRYAGNRQVIAATLCDIELYSCCFNPAKRPYTLSQVIKPFTVNVAGSTPEGEGLHIDICLTEIAITINPSTIELVSKCYQAIIIDSSRNTDDSAEKEYFGLWEPKPFFTNDYWFLKVEEGVDALSIMSSFSFTPIDHVITDEICLLAIPSIVLNLEGWSSKLSKPLLLSELSFQLQCYNWSRKMVINSNLTVQMWYFNNFYSSWEPLVEPVEKVSEKDHKRTTRPWDIDCSIIFGEEGNLDVLQPPKVGITLTCSEILQLTLTKTCLEVLKDVIDTYTSAVTKGVVKQVAENPPYVIRNETGLVVELLMEESKLQVCKSLNDQYKIVKLESNSEVELEHRVVNFVTPGMKFANLGVKRETKLYVKFPISKNKKIELPLGMSSRRYYPIPLQELKTEEVWGLVSDILVTDKGTTVVLQSVLKVVNYFNEPINIHSLSESETEAEFVGTVEGNSSLSLPFHAVYSTKKQLFFSVAKHSLSLQPFVWLNLKNEPDYSQILQCNSKAPESHDPFFIQAVGESEEIYFANTNRRSLASVCYKIHLQPTVKIVNSLPVELIVCTQGDSQERYLRPGNKMQITNAEPGFSTITLRIHNYLEREWSCKKTLLQNPVEFSVWEFISYDGIAPKSINLGVHSIQKRKTFSLTIYCPYLMVNKTGHLLSYKFDYDSMVYYHPGDFKEPLMFSPSWRKFFSKKTAHLKVGHSEWSDKFPVDVPGSGGTVECEYLANNMIYKVALIINLTFNSLTKILIFTPFYVFMNECEFELEFRESDGDWIEMPVNSCTPFWPQSSGSHRTIQIRPKDSTSISPWFCYENTDSCILRLNHKCGGIFANIQATQSGTYVTFTVYEPGQAPALIINHSLKTIKLFQQGTKHSTTLRPSEQVMYSWMEPTGERKLTLRNPKHAEDVIGLEEDIEGLIFTEKGEPVRYVSFLDGVQRVLLFTDDKALSTNISSMAKTTIGTEIVCKLQGIGISVVNNFTRVEIVYISLISNGVGWEYKKHGKKRFKPLNSDIVFKIENTYGKYMAEVDMKEDVCPIFQITDKLKVNFETMEMILPQLRQLRRTFEPGLWVAYRTIGRQLMLHIKINRIQVDNQLADCVFPVILAPVPPPKTLAAEQQGYKPFFEMSIVKMGSDRRGIIQFKYFKILVQEFHVKIDVGFLQQIWEYIVTEDKSDDELKILFDKDLSFMHQPLSSHVEVVSSYEQKHFHDLLHFSPLKIHFSFSLAGNLDNSSLPPFFSVMIRSVGVTLTDLNDVVFRLSYFERRSAFLTRKQLQNEVTTHYYGQIIRQAYILVLGLDVIGNPYGLIVGIGEGVNAFFYEPFQGIIQGPSDFAAGVAIGCKSLFGHTVSSTAGTLGKLTETLGKSLAVLSLDKDYQRQRMEHQNRHTDINASMARGGRGLVMGVYEGLTGVVRKPIEGAKEEGIGGFFKGMGKGMMGLVTRPISGVVDFASTSLNAVKRAADNTVENKRLRLPRFFRNPLLVEPYNSYEAQGFAIFNALYKRKYFTTDIYEHHLELKPKEVVILTNRRIILAELSDLFGTWQEHMAITWLSMPDRPRCHTKGVAITLPAKRDSKGPETKPDVKVLLIDKKEAKEEMCKRMIELYKLEQEEHNFFVD